MFQSMWYVSSGHQQKMKVLEHMIVYDKMVIVQHMVMKYSDNFWNMLYNKMRLECMVI